MKNIFRLPVAISPMLLALACLAYAMHGDQYAVPRAWPAAIADCASCHAAETAAWAGSHHAHAMQGASAATMLGNFDGAVLKDGSHTARFSHDAEHFYVTTEAADGHVDRYEIAYSFGIDPLQQYLLRLPGGRLQAFDIAWDSRPRASGGQRWFALQSPPAKPGEALHWTGRDRNWNFACAPCHSTGIRKGYDADSNTYSTTFDAVNVACAACHGAGARHVAWAEGRLAADDPAQAKKGLAVDLTPDDTPRFAFSRPGQTIAGKIGGGSGAAPEICFGCHSRREALADNPAPGTKFLDAYRPALLEAGLYADDGRNLGEVFEYGAFMQSRMARAGVSCLNCHDAHSLKLKAPGNALCAQCHLPAAFDTPSHTHLAAGTKGACIACHMPIRTYMGVHERHDHGFRRPQPPEFAAAFTAAREGAPADARLRAILDAGSGFSGIVRATAATLLADPSSPDNEATLTRAATDVDPVVRLGAAHAATSFTQAAKIRIAAPLLADPVRAVRVEAARSLADVREAALPATLVPSLRHAIDAFIAAEQTNADRPEAQVELGTFDLRRGDPGAAGRALSEAVRLAPDFTPGLLNLADLRRQSGDEAGAEILLQQAVRIAAPDDPLPLDALALQRARTGDRREAVALLRQASQRAPGDAQTAQLAALAVAEDGDQDAARAILDRSRVQRPNDVELLQSWLRLTPATASAGTVARHLEQLREADTPAGGRRASINASDTFSDK